MDHRNDDTTAAPSRNTQRLLGPTTRREFMQCLAWAGTGLVWTLSGGVLSSRALAAERRSSAGKEAASRGSFEFVQISDSHVGFSKEANPDPVATLREAIARINALPAPPQLLLHTGDLTHTQKAGAFDTVAQIVSEARVGERYFIPGEHDVFSDGGKEFLARFGAGTEGDGWRSFDHAGVRFIGLVNVLSFKSGGAGALGDAQIQWLERVLAGVSDSTPILVYAHIPLWSIYPEWGWTTQDAERALALLRRFGSVTVLNGHIHQVLQKVEGNVTFHTALSTAYPLPAPGAAPAPGPVVVPADRLRAVLGLREVRFLPHGEHLAVVDQTLA